MESPAPFLVKGFVGQCCGIHFGESSWVSVFQTNPNQKSELLVGSRASLPAGALLVHGGVSVGG